MQQNPPWVECIAGALKDSDYVAKLAKAGFDSIDIEPTGYAEALKATYDVGSSVVNELSRNWKVYRDHIPGDRVIKGQ